MLLLHLNSQSFSFVLRCIEFALGRHFYFPNFQTSLLSNSVYSSSPEQRAIDHPRTLYFLYQQSIYPRSIGLHHSRNPYLPQSNQLCSHGPRLIGLGYNGIPTQTNSEGQERALRCFNIACSCQRDCWHTWRAGSYTGHCSNVSWYFLIQRREQAIDSISFRNCRSYILWLVLFGAFVWLSFLETSKNSNLIM